MSNKSTYVVIPNWNGVDTISATLDSLLQQSLTPKIIVVDNGSVDNSVDFIKQKFPSVQLVEHSKNKGFAGGVNAGIAQAMDEEADYIALLNNDAIADKNWLQELVEILDKNIKVGIVTSKLLSADGQQIDSTGEFYTSWGLPYPRGRGEPTSDKYDKAIGVFAASGGASLYRAEMLQEIGIFDESFFAYYEDIDLSFRAQLAGWKVHYVPAAIAFHQIGATSSKIKGFTTYQTLKNLPLLIRKNLPFGLALEVVPRFWLAYTAIFWSAIARGQIWPAVKGLLMSFVYLPHTLAARWKIQKNRQVSVDYINEMLIHDLPPAADRLRALRSKWWQITGRKNG